MQLSNGETHLGSGELAVEAGEVEAVDHQGK